MEQKFISKEIEGIKENNLEKLKLLFPSVFKDGQVDFEELKNQLGIFEEVGQEKYEFNWVGKQEAKQNAISTISGVTIKYYPEESKDNDTTENLYIEGDNLKVLKLLRNNYANKIKMIYIDPPYNTGNDTFVYPDSFKKSDKEIKEDIGITNDGERVINVLKDNMYKNTKDSNKYHSTWLSMMYSRLKIAQELLAEDGVIFISIDDNEQENLKKICNEIFGEENFIGCAGRITKKSNNKGDFWAPNFDYILTYTKFRECANPFLGGTNEKAYNLIETEGERKGERYQLVRLYMSTLQNRNPEQRFWIDCPDGSKIIPPGTTFPPERPNLGDGIWRWTRKKFEEEKDKIVIKEVQSSNLINENFVPAKWNVYTKTYLNDVINNSTAKPNSFIEEHINQIGSHELRNLDIPFDYSKPTTLVKYLMKIAKIDKDAIVMDFFSGSATTADAVFQLNAEDNGNRKFIMVQIPELCDENSEAYKAGYKNICEIGKERIRRAGDKVKKETNAEIDYGFKVFKLDETNINWEKEEYKKNIDDYILRNGFIDEKQRESLMKDFVDGAKDIDIVYEILLRYYGMPLSAKIEKLTDIGERVYSVGGVIIICLEDIVTNEIIDKLSNTNFAKLYFRDSSFKGEDSLELKQNLMTRLNLKKEYKDEKTYKVEFI